MFFASSVSTKKTSVKGGAVKDEGDGDENGHPSKTIKIISTRRVARQPLANKYVTFLLSKKPRRSRTRNASCGILTMVVNNPGMEKEKKDQRTGPLNRTRRTRSETKRRRGNVFAGERRFASKNNLVTRVAPSIRLTIANR